MRGGVDGSGMYRVSRWKGGRLLGIGPVAKARGPESHKFQRCSLPRRPRPMIDNRRWSWVYDALSRLQQHIIDTRGSLEIILPPSFYNSTEREYSVR